MDGRKKQEEGGRGKRERETEIERNSEGKHAWWPGVLISSRLLLLPLLFQIPPSG